jgi:hypothetical protein
LVPPFFAISCKFTFKTIENMKNLLITFCFAFSTCAVSAQRLGFFGHFSIGYGYENWNDFKKDLRLTERLGTDLDIANGGFSGGGGAMFVIDNLLIGGKGYGNWYGSHTTPRGKVELGSAMGFFNLGAMLYSGPKGFGYAYAGIGGGGSGVAFNNWSDNDWDFSNPHVRRHDEESFGFAGVAGELGFAFDRWAIGQNGGLKLGLETGATFWLRQVEWKNDDVVARNLSHPGDVGFYVRATLGGGFLSVKK